ncbi:hypothetical protein SLE2022_310350 [Rubroshorea leprosula]|uniref:Uncharacterized protein n=1 Tax=Rubroshorea leprosula TaxID=152421 RepID=A0AAV5JZU9_9ROSI|nr:hypothetical protein SLEP1_g26890 [Rubroshorea leprosula]
MVCLGVLFGCKGSRSVKDYVLSVLVIIAIVFGLRIFCYAIHRLLKREDSQSRRRDENLGDGSGLEMQPQYTSHMRIGLT